MKGYIQNLNIGVDEVTGLDIELRVKSINIDSEIEVITIKVDKCLVSPTGIQMSILETKYYTRYNSIENKKYDMLDLSPVGLGIKHILSLDLALYPNLDQPS